MAVTPFALGDVVTMRKAHPCGGRAWRVERIGADIGIRCLTCERYVLIARSRLERSLRERQPASAPEAEQLVARRWPPID